MPALDGDTLLDVLPVGTFCTDTDWRVTLWNAAASGVTGGGQDMLGSDWRTIIHPDDRSRVDEAMTRWLLAGLEAVLTFTFRQRSADRWARVYVRALGADGSTTFVMSIVDSTAEAMGAKNHDDTMAAASDDEVDQARIDTVVGVVAEAEPLVTRLAEIIDAANATRETMNSQELAEVLEATMTVTRRLERYLEGLVIATDPARSSPGRFASVAPLPVATRFAEATFGEALSITAWGDTAEAVIAAEQLEQILQQILQNSAEHGAGLVDIHVQAHANDITVTIRNDGMSIAEDTRSRIFDEFFSIRPTGTGLGLTAARNIAEACGGSLELGASEPGWGATLVLTLLRPEDGTVS